MKKYTRIVAGLISFFLVCHVALSFTAAAAVSSPAQTSMGKSDRTVSVFFPLQEHLSERDENGQFSGYAYDYLMRIAQLTGWKYEFVVTEVDDESLASGIESVRDGELDLVISMAYFPQMEEDYLYSAVPYGEANYSLMALKDNQQLNNRTIHDYPGLRVALVEKAVMQNRMFEDYCAQNGIQYQPVYAKDNKACRSLMMAGEADAVIGKDISAPSDCRTILLFGNQPFYFASSRNNQELMAELDYALFAINSAQPHLQEELAQQYFSNTDSGTLSLTVSEMEFIRESPVIRVAALIDRAPVQDYDGKGTFSGIMVDVLEELSRSSGLQFQMIAANDREQAEDMLRTGEADIIAGLPYSYSEPEALFTSGILLTSPVLSMPIFRVTPVTGVSDGDGVLVYENIILPAQHEKVRYDGDIRNILGKINTGEAAEGYVDGYMAQYYMERGNYRNIVVTPSPYSNYNICLGVGQNEDMRLISILEQAISVLSDDQVEHIIYQNTSRFEPIRFWDAVRSDPLPFILPGLLLLVLISVLLLALFLKSRRLNRMISAEGSRYKLLAETDGLTGVLNHATFRLLAADYLNSQEKKISGAMIIMDIDHFKNINDTLGHPAGDEVLRGLSRQLTEVFPSCDLVGRLGGDEFSVLMKDISDRKVVENCCTQLGIQAVGLLSEFPVTLSIGVVLFEEHMSFEELFRQTDVTLYEVKNAGRNGCRIRDFLSSVDAGEEPEEE